MKRISLVLLMILSTYLMAQAPMGSKSLLNMQTARTFDAGRFEIRSDMNFYTKLADFIGNPGLKPSDFKAVNYWLVNGGLALTYGFTNHFDLTVAPGLYQDTHAQNEYNLPDDIRVFAKAGSFDFANRNMYAAAIIGTRFPLGEVHNYPFTYYASGAIEYGFSGALSYYADAYLPDRSFSAHLNIGYWNYNEAGKELRPGKFASVNSQALNYAVGVLYPTDMFDFQMELTGLSYITQPDEFVFSRENWMYVTPSIKYKPFNWARINMGIDFRLVGNKDESVGVTNYANVDLPNYTTWRVHLGLEITVLPILGQSASGESPAVVQKNQFKKRVEFFQKVIDEKEKSEDIKEELDKLKEERTAAEKELQELKQILEEEGGD